MSPPMNSPYGRAAARDRYAPRAQEVEGPACAPSAQHTPLSAVPEQQWNTPRSEPAGAARERAGARTARFSHAALRRAAQQAPHNPGMSELDAPATEFAAPHDSVAGHQHQPGHVPTPDGTYTVEPNDSFWTISQKVYGTGGYFKAIHGTIANRVIRPTDSRWREDPGAAGGSAGTEVSAVVPQTAGRARRQRADGAGQLATAARGPGLCRRAGGHAVRHCPLRAG